MRVKNLDIWLGFLIDGIAVILIPAGIVSGLFRALVALSIVCFLPGYIVVAALFPKYRRWKLVRVTLNIGISLAITVIGSLILNATQWGIQSNSWLFLDSIVILAGGIIAVVRRHQRPSIQEVWNISLFQILLLILAGAISVTGLLLVSVDGQIGGSFTQLWMLRENRVLRIGIASHEYQPERYSLVIVKDNETLYQIALTTIQSGEQWDVSIPIPKTEGKVEAYLYRSDIPQIAYRSVSTWIEAK